MPSVPGFEWLPHYTKPVIFWTSTDIDRDGVLIPGELVQDGSFDAWVLEITQDIERRIGGQVDTTHLLFLTDQDSYIPPKGRLAQVEWNGETLYYEVYRSNSHASHLEVEAREVVRSRS